MYFKIISEKHTFQHNTSSKLLCGLPISLRKVLLFYSNGRYFQYDLCESKILNSWTLLEKPIKVVLSGYNQAFIVTESKKLIELNLQNNTFIDVCRLPRIITGIEVKDRSAFYHTKIVPFSKSNTFYVRQLVEQDNKIRIVYFTQNRDGSLIKEFENLSTIIQPIDQISKVSVYKQIPEGDGRWEVRIIDFGNNFIERKYILQHKTLSGCGIVVKTLLKNENELFIFVNGPNPQILLLNLERGDLHELIYKPQPNLIDIGFYDIDKRILCLFYLDRTESKEEIYQNLMEIIDVQEGRLIEKSHLTIGNPIASLSNQFILDISTESSNGNTSKFFTRHFIKKKSLLFDLLSKTEILKNYGDKLCANVLRILDPN